MYIDTVFGFYGYFFVLFSFFFFFFYCLVGCFNVILWTPAVLSVLNACLLYVCICTCSVQMSMFHMEKRSRNTLITIITIIISPCSRNILFYSIILYSRLCHSTAGSSPPPKSSNFLCPLLTLSIPFPVAPQCHLSNDVLAFRLILHPLSATL